MCIHSHVIDRNALNLNGCWVCDPFFLQGINHWFGKLHLLECLHKRWDILTLCQNVPFLANPLMLVLRCLSDVPRRSPSRLEGFCVHYPLSQLLYTHQSTCLLDTVKDLLLFLSLLVQLRNFVSWGVSVLITHASYLIHTG